MWKIAEKPRTLIATKALVKEFSEMTPAPYDRPLSERRLQVYQRILKAGEFRPCTWASVNCSETGEVYRVNGKHTSIMLSGVIDNLPEFFVTLERYSCDNLHDVAELYNTFDSRLGSRTAHDMNLAFYSTMPEIAGTPKALIHYTVTAASFAKWGEGYTSQSPADRAELLLDNGEFVVWLLGIINTDRKKILHVTRGPVVNAMYTTFHKAKGPATEFWTLVRDETHQDRDNASRTLARFLSRVGVACGRGAKPGKLLSSAREMYVKCIHGWNAWRRNQKTDLKYHPDAKLPSAI